MRFVFYAAFIIFTLLCVIIAVANGGAIQFSLSPLPINVTMPAFMLVFLGIFIGLTGGWIVSIYSSIRHARRHRIANKRIKELENELKNASSVNIELSKDANRGKSSSDK